jgi:hypothetical protein
VLKHSRSIRYRGKRCLRWRLGKERRRCAGLVPGSRYSLPSRSKLEPVPGFGRSKSAQSRFWKTRSHGSCLSFPTSLCGQFVLQLLFEIPSSCATIASCVSIAPRVPTYVQVAVEPRAILARCSNTFRSSHLLPIQEEKTCMKTKLHRCTVAQARYTVERTCDPSPACLDSNICGEQQRVTAVEGQSALSKRPRLIGSDLDQCDHSF